MFTSIEVSRRTILLSKRNVTFSFCILKYTILDGFLKLKRSIEFCTIPLMNFFFLFPHEFNWLNFNFIMTPPKRKVTIFLSNKTFLYWLKNNTFKHNKMNKGILPSCLFIKNRISTIKKTLTHRRTAIAGAVSTRCVVQGSALAPGECAELVILRQFLLL